MRDEVARPVEVIYKTRPQVRGMGSSISRPIIDGQGGGAPAENAGPGKVYVIDDDETMRSSIQNLLASVGIVVETFADAHVFLELPARARPACLVLDVGLPGLSGLELQRRLVEDDAALPIVFLTGRGDIPMSVRAMKAGAVTFLTKPFHPKELLEAIESGLLRDRATQDARREASRLRERFASLTAREREVMGGVVAGLLNKQIGADLGTKEATIKEQRARVMKKMGARSVADLVRMAERIGEPYDEAGRGTRR